MLSMNFNEVKIHTKQFVTTKIPKIASRQFFRVGANKK